MLPRFRPILPLIFQVSSKFLRRQSLKISLTYRYLVTKLTDLPFIWTKRTKNRKFIFRKNISANYWMNLWQIGFFRCPGGWSHSETDRLWSARWQQIMNMISLCYACRGTFGSFLVKHEPFKLAIFIGWNKTVCIHTKLQSLISCFIKGWVCSIHCTVCFRVNLGI